MPSERSRTIRARLFAADPHCHWCGRVTRWVVVHDGRIPDDAATIDHFRSKLDPQRGQVQGEPEYVLACRACNNSRGGDIQFRGVCHQSQLPRKLTPTISGEPLRASIEETLAARTERQRLQQEYAALVQLCRSLSQSSTVDPGPTVDNLSTFEPVGA